MYRFITVIGYLFLASFQSSYLDVSAIASTNVSLERATNNQNLSTIKLFIKKPGENLQEFGKRIIPQGMTLSHPVVEGDFGSSRNNIVILFHKTGNRDFAGWILIPKGRGYQKFVLPFNPRPVSTTIEAVFFDNADRNYADKELFILCKHISGVGHYPYNITPFCNTYVYKWNGNGFTSLGDVNVKLNPVSQTCTAGEIRQLLRGLGY